MRPVIGVTTQVNETPDGLPQVRLMKPYVQALIRAGAAPILFPSQAPQQTWEALYAKADGILFTGGGDIHPRLYGGQMHPRVAHLEEERDQMENLLLRACLQDDKPFFGICRGIQIVNVTLGGTLYENLEDLMPQAIKHDYYPDTPRDYRAHTVRLAKNTWLAKLTGQTSLSVNSLHHQGIRQLAEGLEAIAWAPDGLIEAIELRGHSFGRAVQWHPEWLAPHDADMQAIFNAFVQAAAQA